MNIQKGDKVRVVCPGEPDVVRTVESIQGIRNDGMPAQWVIVFANRMSDAVLMRHLQTGCGEVGRQAAERIKELLAEESV